MTLRKSKTVLLLLLSLFIPVFPQVLSEMEVKQTENKGQIPIFRDYPDKSAVFFYSQFEDLQFKSSYGIVETKNQGGGKYIIIIYPTRQSIEVMCKGYKTEIIKLGDLQPRDVLYYEVLPKAGSTLNVTEIAVTFQIDPPDAKLTIDGMPRQISAQTQLPIGIHTIQIDKDGYASINKEIEVSPSNTLFTFNLERVTSKGVSIRSIPTGASLYLNNDLKGETDKGMFLPPGQYKLRLEKSEYLVLDTTISVSGYQENQEFRFNLTKNRGSIRVSATPASASIRLNGESIQNNTMIERGPGFYTLEVSEYKYQSHRETFDLKIGDNKDLRVNLMKNTGLLVLKVAQKNASLKLNREPATLRDTIELDQGSWIVEVSVNKFDPYLETIEIKPGAVITRNINLDKSTGILQLSVSPPEARILLNKEDISNQRELELSPAVYELEVSAPTYNPQKLSVRVEKQKTERVDIKLVRRTGNLQFQVSPLDAEVELRHEGKTIEKWRGIRIINNLTEGTYELEVKNIGYLTLKKQIEITENKTTVEDINLKKGFESYKVATGNTGYELLFVEGGTFTMGGAPSFGSDEDESPSRQVKVDGFYIGSGEVTRELYNAVMKDISNLSDKKLPVTNVNWFEAVEFCNRLSSVEGLKPAYLIDGDDVTCDFSSDGYRLPTEAEWEFAAKGGNRSNSTLYAGSSSPAGVAVYSDVSGGLSVAGTKKANELGLYDMSGNAWEWVWDWYESYNISETDNPKGPASGSTKVLRGGSAWDGISELRVSNRKEYYPEEALKSFGFRVVRSVYK